MRQLLCLAAVAALVAGCESPNFRFTSADFGDAKALAAGGNLRLITERSRPLAGGAYAANRDWKIVCSEPSPDYLVTFNRKADVQTQGLVVENPSSKASVTLSSDEMGSKGEGRTAGVIALRDGLYAACQAYANGIIGQDAYSAILSQYGFLIATVAVSAGTNPKADAAAKSSSAFAAVSRRLHERTRSEPSDPSERQSDLRSGDLPEDHSDGRPRWPRLTAGRLPPGRRRSMTGAVWSASGQGRTGATGWLNGRG